MHQYKALKPVTFRQGKFQLTAEQMANRRYSVRVLDKETNLVEPVSEINFKAGELITTDIVIVRALEASMQPIGNKEVQITGNIFDDAKADAAAPDLLGEAPQQAVEPVTDGKRRRR